MIGVNVGDDMIVWLASPNDTATVLSIGDGSFIRPVHRAADPCHAGVPASAVTPIADPGTQRSKGPHPALRCQRPAGERLLNHAVTG